MINVLIILLITTNIITIYLLNRKAIKKYFAKSFIKSVNLEKVNKEEQLKLRLESSEAFKELEEQIKNAQEN